jgi:hypothetical protein
MTFEDAVENSCRLLQFAEFETDLAKMGRFIELADMWKCIASVLVERSQI